VENRPVKRDDSDKTGLREDWGFRPSCGTLCTSSAIFCSFCLPTKNIYARKILVRKLLNFHRYIGKFEGPGRGHDAVATAINEDRGGNQVHLGELDYRLISSVASIVMAIVWIVYLHIALVQYRRANRPYMIIHYAHENDTDALCLFVNMSSEPVHLQTVIARIETESSRFSRYLTDYDRITPDDRNVLSRLRQGPIQPGGYLVLGTFEDILIGRQIKHKDEKDKEHVPPALNEIRSLELCIAVVHGPSKHFIGVRRHFFLVCEEEKVHIHPMNIHTEQLVNWRKRKIVRKWVEDRVYPKY